MDMRWCRSTLLRGGDGEADFEEVAYSSYCSMISDASDSVEGSRSALEDVDMLAKRW